MYISKRKLSPFLIYKKKEFHTNGMSGQNESIKNYYTVNKLQYKKWFKVTTLIMA